MTNLRRKFGRKTTISDLSGDLLGQIFSRVPFTDLSAVRSTCKEWNFLSKTLILGEKASKNHHQFLEFMVTDSRVSSLRFDLQGILSENKDDDLVDASMKQISVPNNNNQLEKISQVHHCDGLLLCITNSKLVVWNPYLGQTKLIQPRNKFHNFERFAIGYDINHNHKILRFYGQRNEIDVYDLSSDSWRVLVLDVNPNSDIPLHHTSVSVKGNTYFFGEEVTTGEEIQLGRGMLEVTDIEDYLLCFDFTTERYGPRLPLPFNPPYPCFEALILSWARDDKLAVLYSHYETPDINEIWISTKIEPNAVSWSTFLKIDTSLIIGLPDKFYMHFEGKSFFVDEEKKVAVLFDIDHFPESETRGSQMACIFGEDGYYKSINIGAVPNLERRSGTSERSGKLVCSSYVPSLVQLQV